MGGRAKGGYSSLNLSFRVGDNPELVKDNLCDMKKAVGLHDLRIVTMRQVHGVHIIDVEDKVLKEAGEEAEGVCALFIYPVPQNAPCVSAGKNVPTSL